MKELFVMDLVEIEARNNDTDEGQRQLTDRPTNRPTDGSAA
jgi:hypothetical protein